MIPTPAKRRLTSSSSSAGTNNATISNSNIKQQDATLQEFGDNTQSVSRFVVESSTRPNHLHLLAAAAAAQTSSDEEEEEEEEDHDTITGDTTSGTILFNGFQMVADRRLLNCHSSLMTRTLQQQQQQQEQFSADDELLDGGEIDDEFDYLRLDTILEEEEEVVSDLDLVGGDELSQQLKTHLSPPSPAQSQSKHLKVENDEQRLKSTGGLCEAITTALLDEKQQQEKMFVSNGNGAEPTQIATPTRPLAEISQSAANNSMRKFTTSNQQQASSLAPFQRQQQQLDKSINNNNEINDSKAANNNRTSEQQVETTTATRENKSDNNITSSTQNNNKQTKVKMQQQCNQQLPLPSTNRLISEHQARQQQALFRCLAERQKLMDELGAGQRVDFMSAASLSSSLRATTTPTTTQQTSQQTSSQHRSRRRRRKRRRSLKSSTSVSRSTNSQNQLETGVPLSAVDLSSMSDRMLDELLGHIASASSSSLSSNGESLDSSDLFTDNDNSIGSSIGSGEEEEEEEDEYEDDEQMLRRTSLRDSIRTNAPNVIGVHEDERLMKQVGCAGGTGNNSAKLLNCRDTHRRSMNGSRHQDDDDDDSQNDHELVVHVQPEAGIGADLTSLSPTTGASGATSDERTKSLQQQQVTTTTTSKLEQYFTSNLVNAHDPFSSSDAVVSSTGSELNLETGQKCDLLEAEGGSANHQSVEEVLSRMLEALNEIGTENQEQLNELLERGFGHLEQLLNCSLATGNTSTNANNNNNNQPNRSQPNLAQKLISSSNANSNSNSNSNSNGCNNSQKLSGSSSTTMLSKDSDYGSDTQSADCFSQFNDQADSSNGQAAKLQLQQQQVTNPANNQLVAEASNSSESPSPTSLTTNTSASSSSSSSHSTGGGRGATSGGGNSTSTGSTLSPLAIELSFRLAESLHRLAQQQAAARTRPPVADSPEVGVEVEVKEQRAPVDGALKVEDGGGGEKPISQQQVVGKRKSPMKSIVMINATRSPSVASSVSSQGCSSPQLQVRNDHSSAISHQVRNMTPTSGEQVDSSAAFAETKLTSPNGGKKQPFKTRVNIGSNCVQIVDNNNPSSKAKVIASSITSDKLTKANEADEAKEAKEAKEEVKLESHQTKEDAEEDKLEEQRVKVNSVVQQQQVPTQVIVFGERRRSSIRRRPSFNGSISSQTSCLSQANHHQLQHQREPRPGSPLPRPLLSTIQLSQEEMGSILCSANATSAAGGSKQQAPAKSGGEILENSDTQKQKQLQRALILAQKYNYSPAKLAASKLSSKLHLKDLTSSGQQLGSFNGSQTLNNNSLDKEKMQHNATGNSQTLDQRHYYATNNYNKKLLDQNLTAIKVTGQVQLDISYFAKSGSLTVHVMQCSQLAPVSKRRTTSNPYVKLYLLPDKSKSGKRKSAIHRNQLNPQFDEKFTFGPLQLAEFEQKALWLSVWHKDRLGRNEFLGDVLLPLAQVRQQLLTSDLCQSTSAKWYQLCNRFDASFSNTLNNSSSPSSVAANTKKPSNQILETSANQQEGCFMKVNSSATVGARTGTGTGTGADDRQQQQQNSSSNTLEKLGELQRKAARLTTAVAPPSGSLQQQHQIMNVSLGPLVELGPNRAPITGQLFVALKFVANVDRYSGLSTMTQQTPSSGTIRSSLEGELQVMVKEARNIGGFDMAPLSLQASISTSSSTSVINDPQQQPLRPPAGSLPNPFCKCYLLASNGQRLAKQKTPHLKRTVNPRWDYKCQFTSIRLANLASQAIEIHMFNRDSILVKNNEYLGGVRLCRASPNIITNNTNSLSSSASSHNHQSSLVVNQDAETTSIASSEQSNSELGQRSSSSVFSRQDSSGSGSGRQQNQQIQHTLRRQTTGASDELDEGALCSERESRLWNQMLAKPGIWVYGELKLRQLRPLVANNRSNATANNSQVITTTTSTSN